MKVSGLMILGKEMAMNSTQMGIFISVNLRKVEHMEKGSKLF
jgi:hypothetical protein